VNRRRFVITSAITACALIGGGAPGGVIGEILGQRRAAAVTLEDAIQSLPNRGQSIFGSTEVASRSFRALPQWRRVLKRMKIEGPTLSECSNVGESCARSPLEAWRRIIVASRDHDRAQKLSQVNRYFNRWPYKEDTEVYGMREYWASPMEFLRRSGDCEDFAIAKFFALRQLGFSNEEMRVIILWDRIRAIGHAVLAVYEKNDILVLDSLSDRILSHWKYKQYVPQYSMNETTRWAHVKV
jgi:predicted transglutaminase-like cysteine proteinase